MVINGSDKARHLEQDLPEGLEQNLPEPEGLEQDLPEGAVQQHDEAREEVDHSQIPENVSAFLSGPHAANFSEMIKTDVEFERWILVKKPKMRILGLFEQKWNFKLLQLIKMIFKKAKLLKLR